MTDQDTHDAILKQLKEKEAKFKEELKEAKKKIARREAELKKRRAAIIGKALLAEAEQNPDILQTIIPVIEKHIKSKRDKEMLGFMEAENEMKGA